MKTRTIYIIILLSTLIGCKHSDKYESYFATDKFSEVNIKNFEINLDTIKLEKMESSYLGAIDYLDTIIAFVDYRFCWVYLFDLNGKLIEKKLGRGRGPNELNMQAIDGFCFLDNGNRVFLGSSNDIHIHDKNWKRVKDASINWKGRFKMGSGKVIKNPSPDEPGIYSLDYENLKLQSIDNTLYMPIYSEHPNFNGFTGFDYYKKGNILAELNLKTLEVERLFGRRTPELLKYKYLMHHSTFNFDIDKKNNFYIAHEIDPLIYVYNKEFKVQYAFGVAGKDMDTDYQELGTKDLKKFRQLYFKDRPQRGYYTGIKAFMDQGLVFRSYKKNGSAKNDGLQIYKDKILIKDIEVPKNFKVKKYIPPYFYSTGLIDEEKEEVKIIRFKLPNNF